jgi:hypothetical protein
VFRKRLGYPDLKRAVREQAGAFDPQTIMIEDKASGTQLIQELVNEGMHAIKKIMAAQKAATVPESMQSPPCNGVAQWPPAGTQQRVQFPTRTDILNGVKFGRF